MSNEQTRFVIDSSLGTLAKWLKIMGFDAHYQSLYQDNEIEKILKEGRTLLTKNRQLQDRLDPLILITHNKIKDQLLELKNPGFLPMDRKYWFRRCIICNVPLHSVQSQYARGRIPDFVIHQNTGEIKFCPKCKRYFWPGSHRVRMIKQLEAWGL
ncbi:MAG: hypothetical protein JW927_01440 [Deltaproteobacteria bacterium]|nr:hypothetical protein [Deltaproteobacteria bacterium]